MNERTEADNELREWAREVLLLWPVDLGYAPERWARELESHKN